MQILKKLFEMINGAGSWNGEIDKCVDVCDYYSLVLKSIVLVLCGLMFVVAYIHGAYYFVLMLMNEHESFSIGQALFELNVADMLVGLKYISLMVFVMITGMFAIWCGIVLRGRFDKVKERFCQKLSIEKKETLKRKYN